MARERAAGEVETGAVLSDGILFEASAGDPGLVIARDVGSGKELWRAELGAVTSRRPYRQSKSLSKSQIAGTPWMTLDRSTGEPVE